MNDDPLPKALMNLVALRIQTLPMALVQYYSGILTDRVGRRTILVYSQIPAVLFYLLIFYTIAVPNYYALRRR